MEKTYTMTRTEIIKAFRYWNADVEANPTKYQNHPGDAEASADWFLIMAGLKVEG